MREHPHILAFASHHLPIPLQPAPDFDYHIIMMLRHPVVRARSAYSFERKQQVDNASANAAKCYDFADYVRWHLDMGSKMFLNYFIRYCTSTITEPLTDQLRLQYALSESQRFSVLGIVEQFEDSMALLQSNLAKHHIDITLIKSRKNITDHSSDSTNDKLARIESELGEQLYATLFECNKEDLLFYEHALEQLNAVVRSVS